MVYCGPPSKACIACHRRKIGCDQSPRGCRQCARSRKPCPGYRDHIDLLFKDQNQWVRKKFAAASNRDQSIPDAPNGDQPAKNNTPLAMGSDVSSVAARKVRRPASRPCSASQDPVDVLHPLPLVAPIPVKLQDLGTTVFFRLYAQFRHAEDCGIPCPAFFDYAGTVLSGEITNHIVATCIEAVGLASVANMQRDRQIMARARRGYIVALRGVNGALRIASEASKDTTLLAVMLLNLFEHISCSDSDFLDAWTQHVNGAALLVQLRGRRQLTYQLGMQLFEQFCQTLTSNCIQNGIPVPQQIVDIREQCAQHLDTKSIFWQLSDTTIKLAQLRSMIVLEHINDPSQVLREALEIAQELKDLEGRLWIEMPYTICSMSSDPRLYKGIYHLYPGVGALHAWNSLRISHCLLHQLRRTRMLKAFLPIPPSFLTPQSTSLFETSHGTLRQVIDDILCSAPQPLGWAQGPPSTREGTGQGSQATVAGSKLLIWPFYVVFHIAIKNGLCDHVDGVDGYMISVLEDVGQQTGILAATVLADLLRQNQFLARFPDIIKNGFRMGQVDSS